MTIDQWHQTPQSSHVAAITWECVGFLPLKEKAGSGLSPNYGTLYVAFKNGRVDSYEGVSENDYMLIVAAESTGRALHRLGITHPRGRRSTLVGRFDPETGEAIR